MQTSQMSWLHGLQAALRNKASETPPSPGQAHLHEQASLCDGLAQGLPQLVVSYGTAQQGSAAPAEVLGNHRRHHASLLNLHTGLQA